MTVGKLKGKMAVKSQWKKMAISWKQQNGTQAKGKNDRESERKNGGKKSKKKNCD